MYFQNSFAITKQHFSWGMQYKGDKKKGKKAFVEQFPYSAFSSCAYIGFIHLYLCGSWTLHWNISFSSLLYLQRKTSLKPFGPVLLKFFLKWFFLYCLFSFLHRRLAVCEMFGCQQRTLIIKDNAAIEYKRTFVQHLAQFFPEGDKWAILLGLAIKMESPNKRSNEQSQHFSQQWVRRTGCSFFS